MRSGRSRAVQFAGATALAAAVAVAAACGGSSDAQTVTAPTGTVVTETFMGSVQPPVAGMAQFDSHSFTVTVGGNAVNITLVSAGPPATIKMGLGIGNPSSTGTCSLLTNGAIETAAGSTAQLSGSTNAGTFCVVVFDTGNVLQPVSYTVTVAHT